MIPREARRREVVGAALGAVALALPMAFLWGFSVDDAFITARVAAHVASGVGHRFNSGGPVVDAVTPLAFPYLIAPFSGGDVLRAYLFTKWLGAASGLASAALLGAWLSRRSRSALVVLVPLALSTPLAAWCVSGMETGLVVLLCTLSLVGTPFGALAAGLAASLRPELVPWAVASVALSTFDPAPERRRPAMRAALALGPAVLVALVRTLAFGSPVPLAFHAKPSDAAHGLFYVAGALLWTGAPWLVVAPGIRSLPSRERGLLAAFAVHCLALVACGGDWMSLFRLFVPILPSLFLVGGRLVADSSWPASAVRVGMATVVSAVLLASKGPVARGVEARRFEFIRDARPALSGATRIAALDVGWVGVASPAAIVDLAGVTDASVARLPGGHTSKHIPERFLEHRGADAVVLLLAPGASVSGTSMGEVSPGSWARAVEARAAHEAAELSFVVRAVVPRSGGSERYVVLRVQNGP
ncbi:MAG TPA: hypothetical protein VHE30_09130 [Polyangiaceae bacterium]|nr:hypothetical protein [Polyangiaceae bacterium]